MKHLLGVCLKDDYVSVDGYVRLTDTNCVACIYYVSDEGKEAGGFIVGAYSSKDFLENIESFDGYGYLEDDVDDTNLCNPINNSKKIDKYVKEHAVTSEDRYTVAKDFRNTRDIVLFYKSSETTYLGEYNQVYYFWRSPKIVWVKVNNKLAGLKASDRGKTKDSKEIPPALRVLLYKEDIRREVLNTYKDLVGIYKLTREEAVNFILETFMYRSKSLGLTIDREKAINILCLGENSDSMSEEIQAYEFCDFSENYAILTKKDKAKFNSTLRYTLANFKDEIQKAISDSFGNCNKDEKTDNVLDEIFDEPAKMDEAALKKQVSEAFNEYRESIEKKTALKAKKDETKGEEKDCETTVTDELKGVLETNITPKVFNKRSEQLVLDITKEMNETEFRKGNPSCTKCRGNGYIVIDFFGAKQKVKCDCVDSYNARLNTDESDEVNQKFKVGGTALNFNAMVSGLIPRERINDILDFRVMGDRVAKLNKAGGYTINMTNYEAYKNTLRNVFSFLIANRKLDYSILISVPNGFGKTTFVYSCIKLMLINGQAVAPYVSLFKLAQLRYDYMTMKSWRRSEISDYDYAYKRESELQKLEELKQIKRRLKQLKLAELEPMTDTEVRLAEEASYNGLLEYHTKEYNKLQKELLEEKDRLHKELGYDAVSFEDMTDKEKDDYILEKQMHNYTYEDYLNADILFCQLSVAEQAYVEISTLKAIMDYRGINCKPTIIMTDRDIDVYKESVLGMATDMYLIDEMLTDDIKLATYDRAYYVSVKKNRVKKTALKKGKNV